MNGGIVALLLRMEVVASGCGVRTVFLVNGMGVVPTSLEVIAVIAIVTFGLDVVSANVVGFVVLCVDVPCCTSSFKQYS